MTDNSELELRFEDALTDEERDAVRALIRGGRRARTDGGGDD